MTLATYNGFTSDQRMAAHYWQQKEIRAGRLPAPHRCIACGQHEGAHDAHLEDYDQPGRYFDLCLVCHLFLHCRFRMWPAWEHFKSRISRGWVPPGLPRQGGFMTFSATYRAGKWPVGDWRDPPGATFLDQLGRNRLPAELLVP